MSSLGRKISLVGIVIGMFAVGVFFLTIMLVIKTNKTTFEPPIEYNEGWYKQVDNKNCTIVLRRMITDAEDGKAISFYVYDAYVRAYMDDVEIYHYGEPLLISTSPSSVRHMVSIPTRSAGSILTITIETVFPSKFSPDVDIVIGDMGSLIVHYIQREMVDIILNIVLIIMGLVLFVIFFAERTNGVVEKGTFYLGMLCLLFFLGSSCDLYIFQLLAENNMLLYFLYYYVLYTVPLVLLGYVHSLSENYRCAIIAHTHLVLIIALICLHFTKVAELTETLPLYLVITSVECVVIAIVIIRAGIVRRSNILFYALIIMLVAIMVNVLLFIIEPEKGVSMFLAKLGICVYVFAAISNYVQQLVLRIAAAHNAELLKKQALTDVLTGLGNRLAFVQEIDSISLERLSIVSFDVNNLKYYNDNKGHLKGDSLIVRAADILSSVYDKVYRTGGDEYMAIVVDADKTKLERLKIKLCEDAKAASNDDMIIEIACGYSSYMEGDQSYEAIIVRSDEEMYKHKLELKRVSPIAAVR